MFASRNRLPRTEVKRVMRFGRRATSPQLTLIYCKRELKFATTNRNSRLQSARFAIIVPKSVDKRATARNRMKRLVREALRKLLPEIKQGIDGVIIVRKKLASLREAEDSIRELVLGGGLSLRDHSNGEAISQKPRSPRPSGSR